jgi:TatD DNase family protein
VRLFDSHAHLTDGSFASELEDVLTRAAEEGVESLVSVASDLEDARDAIALARRSTRPRVLATAGIHPHEAHRCSPEALSELEALARSEPVAAIGETGLDFHRDNAPRDAQLEAFRSQIEVAERLGLPVVVHSRAADDDLAAILSDYAGRVVGVLHCFTGGPELLETGLRAGWYVSFSGIVTFKNFRDACSVQRVPGDRVLVETDSPFLAPVPLRGRRNEPAFVRHVVERVAELRGEDPRRLADVTYENACRFYRLGS